MEKNPYVYVNLQLIFKNAPKEYEGLVRDNWTVGKNSPIPASLSSLLWGIIRITTEFYCTTMQPVDVKEVNAELDSVTRILSQWRLVENNELPNL